MHAVFFDLDGTLADTMADLADTVNHTRRDLGLSERPVAEVIACVGCGARYLLEHAIPEVSDFDATYARFKARYAEHATNKVQLYPGVRETLSALARRGWKLGVNTNKPRFATVKILEHFGLLPLFGEAIVAGGDCAKMKPDAEPLVACARKLGHALSPDDWMVGDSWTDLDCAANAGIRSAFCTYGFGRLGDAAYTKSIDRFEQLLELMP